MGHWTHDREVAGLTHGQGTCLENLEMSENLKAVREMSGN